MISDEDKKFIDDMERDVEAALRKDVLFFSQAVAKATLGIPLTIDERVVILMGASCFQIKLYKEEILSNEENLDPSIEQDIINNLKEIDFSKLDEGEETDGHT